MLRNARVLALMNIALADATIAIWNAKNTYDTWRPITAIQQAATDGNPDTSPDPNWTPLLVTPAFQEYPAGHPGVSLGTRDGLRRRHRVHRHLARATRRRAQLHELLIRGRASRERARVGRHPLPLRHARGRAHR